MRNATIALLVSCLTGCFLSPLRRIDKAKAESAAVKLGCPEADADNIDLGGFRWIATGCDRAWLCRDEKSGEKKCFESPVAAHLFREPEGVLAENLKSATDLTGCHISTAKVHVGEGGLTGRIDICGRTLECDGACAEVPAMQASDSPAPAPPPAPASSTQPAGL